MQFARAPFLICLFFALLFPPFVSAQKYLFNRLDIATGTAPQGVAVADPNKDGITDFAVANSGSGSVSVFLGKSDGTFQAPSTLTTGSATAPQL